MSGMHRRMGPAVLALALAGGTAAAEGSPEARVTGEVRLLAGVDTGFERRREDALSEQVAGAWSRARLETDVKLSESLRLVVEGRALWRAGLQYGGERAKSSFEGFLGEAYVDWYTPRVDVRVGQQVLAWGANAAFAPTDVLTPRDLRTSLLLTEPDEARLPAFAVRALAPVGPLTVSAVWTPFFAAHRYDVFGQDVALLQPGLGLTLPLAVEASAEDELQEGLLETQRPGPLPGDLGLRVQGEVEGIRLGASWVWAAEKLPQVALDPELEALLRASSRGETPDTALVLSVQERLRAGESLATGRYLHRHVVGAEASALVGPLQLDVDVGWASGQTFYSDRQRPVWKPTWTWVVGLSQAEQSDWVYSLTYVGLAVPGVEAQELLLLLEPGTARGVARTALFHLLVAEVRYMLPGGQWEAGMRAAFEPVQRSWALVPRVEWHATERLHMGLAAEVYEGVGYSPWGYWSRNDQVVATLRLAL